MRFGTLPKLVPPAAGLAMAPDEERREVIEVPNHGAGGFLPGILFGTFLLCFSEIKLVADPLNVGRMSASTEAPNVKSAGVDIIPDGGT